MSSLLLFLVLFLSSLTQAIIFKPLSPPSAPGHRFPSAYNTFWGLQSSLPAPEEVTGTSLLFRINPDCTASLADDQPAVGPGPYVAVLLLDDGLGSCFLTQVSRSLSQAPHNIVGFVGVQNSFYPTENGNSRRPFDFDPTGLMASACVGYDEEGKSLADLVAKGPGTITVTLEKPEWMTKEFTGLFSTFIFLWAAFIFFCLAELYRMGVRGRICHTKGVFFIAQAFIIGILIGIAQIISVVALLPRTEMMAEWSSIYHVFFWITLILGLFLYTRAVFCWIDIVGTLRGNDALNKFKLVIYVLVYLSMVFFFIGVIVIDYFPNAQLMLAMNGVFALICLLESILFLFYGIKILLILRSGPPSSGGASNIKLKLSIMIISSVAVWIVAMIFTMVSVLVLQAGEWTPSKSLAQNAIKETLLLVSALVILITFAINQRDSTTSHHHSSQKDSGGGGDKRVSMIQIA